MLVHRLLADAVELYPGPASSGLHLLFGLGLKMGMDPDEGRSRHSFSVQEVEFLQRRGPIFGVRRNRQAGLQMGQRRGANQLGINVGERVLCQR